MSFIDLLGFFKDFVGTAIQPTPHAKGNCERESGLA
jgi:hypothetical protein